MSRSIKKGPFVDPSLQDKIDEAQKTNSRKPIQTWSRRSVITPDFIGLNFNVHNGSRFSRTIETIQELEPNATVIEDGFTISEQNVPEAVDDVASWLQEIGY